MRIAIDFDGTIADTNQLHNAFCKEQFGIDLPIEATVSPLREKYFKDDWGKIGQLREYLYGEATLQAPLVPGVREALQQLEAEGHYIIILTARGESGVRYPKEYMRLHQIPYDRFLFVSEKEERMTRGGIKLTKKLVIERLKLDVMIEDQTKGLSGLQQDVIAILLTRPWNKNVPVPRGIIRLPTWNAIIQFLLTATPAKTA